MGNTQVNQPVLQLKVTQLGTLHLIYGFMFFPLFSAFLPLCWWVWWIAYLKSELVSLQSGVSTYRLHCFFKRWINKGTGFVLPVVDLSLLCHKTVWEEKQRQVKGGRQSCISTALVWAGNNCSVWPHFSCSKYDWHEAFLSVLLTPGLLESDKSVENEKKLLPLPKETKALLRRRAHCGHSSFLFQLCWKAPL